ncbi:type I-E CRISPR-associated protein Cas7/Cse4/CasC [Streptomyces sp. NPDC005538]|uniref:type I-E CRISPR-associated protein Cas7/Cse4/CasC n=1 Tax=Streptomyces sp. NPDC005538 TaxID=3157043 RepID=UPI0033BDAAA8
MATATDLAPAADHLEIDTTDSPGPFVVIHTLTTVTGVNLNSDETGVPKTAMYGGTERLRVSAQALSRAMRAQIREKTTLEEQAVRSRLLPQQTARLLEERGIDPADATAAAALIVAAAGVAVNLERPEQTKSVLTVSPSAPGVLAELVLTHFDDLADARQAMEKAIVGALTTKPAPRRGRTAKAKDAADQDTEEPPKASKPEAPAKLVPYTVATQAQHALAPGTGLEVALFGRMIAELPRGRQPSTVQVAHACSVDPVEMLADEFTATDDWQDLDVFGSAMKGTHYLSSATLYRFAALDRNALRRRLLSTGTPPDAVEDRARRAELLFTTAAVYAVPPGRSSRTGSAVLPTLAIAASCDTPASAMPAFEEAIQPPAGLTAATVLGDYLTRLPAAAQLRGGTARWLAAVPAPALPAQLTADGAH